MIDIMIKLPWMYMVFDWLKSLYTNNFISGSGVAVHIGYSVFCFPFPWRQESDTFSVSPYYRMCNYTIYRTPQSGTVHAT